MTEPLRPVTTETVQTRSYNDGNNPDVTRSVETVYRIAESDTVWLGLGSVAVQRGDRYSGTEETVKLEIYSSDVFKHAVLQLVRDQQRYSREETGYLWERADSFLADLRAALQD
jgi:hypothetical protein